MQPMKQPWRFSASLLLFALSADAFAPPSLRRVGLRSSPLLMKASVGEPEQVMDDLLKDGDKLRLAVRHLRDHPQLDMTRERWRKVFDAIEVRTSEAEENNINTRAVEQQYPPTSPARMDMTDMYSALKEMNHLKLFGAVKKEAPPAAGSHIVTPNLLERITELSMSALTPKPTNTLLYAGGVLAILEGIVSLYTGINLNFLVLSTLFFFFLDRLLINGAVFESVIKLFMPGIQNKILRHEAGHFLTAYLLGCPVEGCVLSAWAALQDARFGGRRTGVSAGTSFFDPVLSEQINTSVVTRSSIDRYSVIVMGGIAAEAIHYGLADGGAGDEAALVAFLRQLNGGRKSSASGGLPPWNEQSIRNQARWGALQAVLMLRHYKPCYDALVGALERGGNLGDCIYAIEEAGRDNNLHPLDKPLGYIVDKGEYGEWTTEMPKDMALGPYSSMIESSSSEGNVVAPTKTEDHRPTQEVLQEYKEIMQDKLRDIDERLKDM